MNTNDSALFAAAKSSMDSLFKEVTGQNIVSWRVRNKDAFVVGASRHIILLNLRRLLLPKRLCKLGSL